MFSAPGGIARHFALKCQGWPQRNTHAMVSTRQGVLMAAAAASAATAAAVDASAAADTNVAHRE